MPWSPSLRSVLPHRPDPKPADRLFLKALAPSGSLRLRPSRSSSWRSVLRGFFRRSRGVPGTPAAVRPSFRDARFGLLVAGEAVNSTGGWASAIVLWGFAAYRFNASPYAVSLTIVCWAAPPAVLSPLLGVWVDRIGPRKALVAGYVAAAVAALGMAAAGSLPVLDAAAAGYGIARSL